ncbi:hypothetical protein L1887_15511 [Cichorium endivia]|nr:hypothetical protein L1887_15511 [Cichorium endivia]
MLIFPATIPTTQVLSLKITNLLQKRLKTSVQKILFLVKLLDARSGMDVFGIGFETQNSFGGDREWMVAGGEEGVRLSR